MMTYLYIHGHSRINEFDLSYMKSNLYGIYSSIYSKNLECITIQDIILLPYMKIIDNTDILLV
jgi:hypothetical protein